LGKLDSWLVMLGVGGIDHYLLCIVGVVLGDSCAFILAWVMLLSRNRLSLSRSRRNVCLM
jgi:hypothetical protein